MQNEECHYYVLNILLTQVGLTKVKIENKLVYIKVDNGSMFARCITSVFMQLKDKLAPLLVVVHCCAHHTNLANQVLFTMAIMQHLGRSILVFALLFFFTSQENA